MARVAQRAIHLLDRAPTGLRPDAARLEHVRARRDTSAAISSPARRATCVSGRGQQREKRLDHRVVPRESIATRRFERRYAGLERDRERRGVLSRDPVARGSEPHHLEQRQRRLVRDILRLRPPEAARRRAANRRVDVPCVIHRGRLEHSAERAAEIPGCADERRAREGRQKEDDAEVRVRARPAGGRLDGEAHRRADRARARTSQRLANRGRAGEEILVARVGEMAPRRDVARLRSARLEEAGQLRRDRDICRSPRDHRAPVHVRAMWNG